MVHEYTTVEEQDGEFGGCDKDAVGKLDGIHQLNKAHDVWDRVEYGMSPCAEMGALKLVCGLVWSEVERWHREACSTYIIQALRTYPNTAPMGKSPWIKIIISSALGLAELATA